jgi:hypothetical protein
MLLAARKDPKPIITGEFTMSKIALARLFFGLVLLTTALSIAPAWAAICGREVTKTYWAWIDNTNPNLTWCAEPHFSPYTPVENYAHWGVIGEKETDCNGVVTTWGDTTTCTAPANTTTSSSACYCSQSQ